jgi:hypothetical protein
VTSQKGLLVVGPKLLAKCWKIRIETAQCTLEATTQICIRTMLHPTLLRRLRTNDPALQYIRLSHEAYTDTMKAKSVLWFCQNKYAQVFCMRFGWTRIYPMQLKSEAHLGLLLMFQHDGVPIMDGSKEQTMGQFRVKARRQIVRSNKLSHILHVRMQQSLQSERPSVQLVERWLHPNAHDGYGIIALNWRQ